MRVETFLDDMAECPLTSWEHCFKFFSCHRRYYTDQKSILSADGYSVHTEDDFDSLEDIEAFLNHEKYVWVKVYMYSHSGDTISSTPFNCRWDSGVFGYLYASKKDILSTFGGNILTKKLKEKAISEMENFINGVWCAYIEGECYGYKILDDNDEELDACWGYYGEDNAIEAGEYMLAYFQNEAIAKAQKTQSNINYFSATA